jgi:hypothetical protein
MSSTSRVINQASSALSLNDNRDGKDRQPGKSASKKKLDGWSKIILQKYTNKVCTARAASKMTPTPSQQVQEPTFHFSPRKEAGQNLLYAQKSISQMIISASLNAGQSLAEYLDSTRGEKTTKSRQQIYRKVPGGK